MCVCVCMGVCICVCMCGVVCCVAGAGNLLLPRGSQGLTSVLRLHGRFLYSLSHLASLKFLFFFFLKNLAKF